MSISTFDLFKVGIGPSSSHTVGPMVAARRFAEQLQKSLNSNVSCVQRIRVELFGSLGATGNGHGTPKAVVLGLLGESPETVDVDKIPLFLKTIGDQGSLALLGQNDFSIPFSINDDILLNRRKTLSFHPNGMQFSAYDNQGNLLLDKEYFSVGGGFIIGEESPGNFSLKPEDDSSQPFAFNSAEELLDLCDQHRLTIAELVKQNELQQHSDSEVSEKLDQIWNVMQACVERGCKQEGVLPGSLKVQRRAPQLLATLNSRGNQESDPLSVLDWVTLYALAVNEENAAGGRVVTAPTNGAAGIIPAVMHYYVNFIADADLPGVHTFLLTAAAIGMLYKKNASISGAEVGCQGEVGSACSMAAGGLTAVLGGSPEQIENAAEIAMEHHLGLTCDPVGGLVQIPCIERNAVASVNAIHAARMALNNQGEHLVSLDKVIKTMKETGRDMMDKYKETSRGGLATNVVEVPVNIIEC